jgi:hypothetical protein
VVIGAFILTLGVSLVLYSFTMGGLFIARLFQIATDLNQFHPSRSMPMRPHAPDLPAYAECIGGTYPSGISFGRLKLNFCSS